MNALCFYKVLGDTPHRRSMVTRARVPRQASRRPAMKAARTCCSRCRSVQLTRNRLSADSQLTPRCHADVVPDLLRGGGRVDAAGPSRPSPLTTVPQHTVGDAAVDSAPRPPPPPPPAGQAARGWRGRNLRGVADGRRELQRLCDLPDAERRREQGLLRARSHCRSVLPLIRLIPDSLTYSVPLYLKRQCDRTLGLL
jgi:hypothetical protein